MLKILIVDDERISRDYMAYVLGEMNREMKLFFAGNGLEAVKVVEKTHPDLLLMDIKMPVLGGLEAIESIKEMIPRLPIILITAHQDYKYTRKAIQLKVSDYLLKPIAPNDLKAVLIPFFEASEQNRTNDDSEGCNDPLMIEAMAFIESHYAERIYLEDIATRVGYHPDYFSKRFRELAGQNFSTYLLHYRIDRGKELLRDTRMSIKEISQAVGFTSSGYFSKQFNKITKETPSSYRKRLSSQDKTRISE